MVSSMLVEHKARILVVDDHPQNVDLICETLGYEQYDFRVATNGKRAIDLANQLIPDMILLDVMMPEMNGFEVCEHLKNNSQTAAIPILFVTAKMEDISQGFNVGAVDYILKPINADEVRSRVAHHLAYQQAKLELESVNEKLESKVRERTFELSLANRSLREEVNERRLIQDRLSYLAEHDFFTRLYNRSALELRVSAIISNENLVPSNCFFAMIDLAHFKAVNESAGCLAGDELLRQVADLLLANLDNSDFCARIGGDNFAVILEATSLEHAVQRMEALAAILNDYHFYWRDQFFRVGSNVAVVAIDKDVHTFEDVLMRADTAMHLAKSCGANQLRVFAEEMADTQERKAEIALGFRLKEALSKHQFILFFQKIYCKDHYQHGGLIEILLRLKEDSGRIVPPSKILGPAERFRIMSEIDRWVVAESLKFFQSHPQLVQDLERVSINLSSLTLRDSSLPKYIAGLLDGSGIPAEKICFEITESRALENIERTADTMDAIRDLGCVFALDDFGSGFASYEYLRRLPVDILKIDGSFIKDMLKDDASASMVSSMVAMGKALGKTIVAEHVEGIEEREALENLDVPHLQGYLFHMPELLTVEALTKNKAQVH